MKVITVGTVINRFNITGYVCCCAYLTYLYRSLARTLVRSMRESGKVRVVGSMHSKMWICTGSNVKAKVTEEAPAK